MTTHRHAVDRRIDVGWEYDDEEGEETHPGYA
jgi:hypothetical protein